jgi:polyhydroxyalkanoate synthesis regulator phasin
MVSNAIIKTSRREEAPMTKAIAERSGRFQRIWQTLLAWEQAMDHTPFDYTFDRIEALEQQVLELRDEVKWLHAGDTAHLPHIKAANA